MPLVVAREARREGRTVLVAAIEGITDPALETAASEIRWLSWGDLPGFFALLQEWQAAGVAEAIMAGKVEQPRIYQRDADGAMEEMLAGLPSGHTDELLGAVANVLENVGIRLLESTRYLGTMMAAEGRVAGRHPSDRENVDIEHGWRVAKRLGELDIGQTVVVKDRAVVAVEGMEGTDACIRRGGDLAGPGCVVVKTAKPKQDLRFDVPVVGAGTIEVMQQVGATALAVEAKMTVIFDRARIEELAADLDLAVLARCDD